MFFDQFANRHASGTSLTPVLSRARNGITAKTLGLTLALAGKPVGALFDNVTDPEQSLHIIDQSRTVEDADLRHIRWPVARQSALALDTFDHRGFFTANVCAGAAAEFDLRDTIETSSLDLRDLFQQDLANTRVLVPQIDVNSLPSTTQAAISIPSSIRWGSLSDKVYP